MKNIAPDIFRKRLLIEAYFNISVDEKVIASFFDHLTNRLRLRTYGDPIIHHTGGQGAEQNQGYDAFVPLIDSGIYLAIWSHKKFLSMIVYTCADFDEKLAVEETSNYFRTKEIVFEGF